MIISLPWPSSALSGHNKGNYYVKAKVVATHRATAFHAVRDAKVSVPELGDISLRVRFVPPTKQGDRINFPNRMKPYFDGIAEALGVNDARFSIPVYEVAGPEKPGRVEVEFYPQNPQISDVSGFTSSAESCIETNGLSGAETPSGRDQSAFEEQDR